MNIFSFLKGKQTTKTSDKRTGGSVKKIPQDMRDLDPSYRALIRELAKR